ncbi:hypothetical protein EDB80DRAFT_896636 [Ilyonectria destructans]|nr:hypothetical protein EDB80DRAFT_896636 [Ilyonectria destructans]
MHRALEFQFDNLNLEGIYHPWTAYGQSKTAIIWTGNEIERRYSARLKKSNMFHFFKSPEQGAATLFGVLCQRIWRAKVGYTLEDCQVIGGWNPESGDLGTGYATWAYDEAKAIKFWEVSLELVPLKDVD